MSDLFGGEPEEPEGFSRGIHDRHDPWSCTETENLLFEQVLAGEFMTDMMLYYNGTGVLFDSETGMGCLTAMWKACGSPENKEPWNWTRDTQAQEIIAALTRKENLLVEQVLETRQGRNGGTWAHWQIATVYAHYLDPEFYLTWNEFARSYLEGKDAPAVHNEALLAELNNLRARVQKLEGQQHQQFQPPQQRQQYQPSRTPNAVPQTMRQIIVKIMGELPQPVDVDTIHATILQQYPRYRCKRNTLLSTLSRMVQRGLIVRVGFGWYETQGD